MRTLRGKCRFKGTSYNLLSLHPIFVTKKKAENKVSALPVDFTGRGERIRTSDHLNPILMIYGRHLSDIYKKIDFSRIPNFANLALLKSISYKGVWRKRFALKWFIAWLTLPG
jgi:hypothetical protein